MNCRPARAALRIAAILALGAPAAFAQNSFEDTITRQRPSGSAQQPAPASDAARARAPESESQSAAQAPAEADPRFARAAEMEARDFGVEPTARLHAGAMHGQTPTRIPGGLVVDTEALAALYERGKGAFLVFDVLGGPQILPDAQNALGAAQAGTFNDQTQREFGQYLQQVTGGNKGAALVFYCQSVECWMSYNAALRAINLGYTQVLWYRGGIEAWQAAGLPTRPNR